MHGYVTPGGRKVWDRWGPKACYNRRGNIRPPDLHCHKPCRPHLTKQKRRAGANTAWIAALKEFNAENVTWCVPKKGNPKRPLPAYRKVMEIKERIEKERLIRKIGKPPQLERVADEGNWPRAIPKKGQTQQQANLQAAAIAADKKRREEEAEGYRLAQEWAREQEAKKAARAQKFIKDNAWTALPARVTRSGRGG